MKSRFKVQLPLALKWDSAFTITFTLQRNTTLEFNSGVYFLQGDNGSGKTTFLNLLALTAGSIGNARRKILGHN